MKSCVVPLLAIAAGLLPLSAFAGSGTLHVVKECSEYTGAAGAFCTITESNLGSLPAGSKVVYADAALPDNGLDTDIEITTPGGDMVRGHVVLDGKTETGTVVLSGGTGALAALTADLKVAPMEAPKYSWDGAYSD
jgi:hypothetical protein